MGVVWLLTTTRSALQQLSTSSLYGGHNPHVDYVTTNQNALQRCGPLHLIRAITWRFLLLTDFAIRL